MAEEQTHTQQDVWMAVGFAVGFVVFGIVAVINAKIALIGLGLAFVLLLVGTSLYDRRYGTVVIEYPGGKRIHPGDLLRCRVRHLAPASWDVERAVARVLCIHGKWLTNSHRTHRTLQYQEEIELARDFRVEADQPWEVEVEFRLPTEVTEKAWVDSPGLSFTYQDASNMLGVPNQGGFPGLQNPEELDDSDDMLVVIGPGQSRPVRIRWMIEVVLEFGARRKVEAMERFHVVGQEAEDQSSSVLASNPGSLPRR